MPNDKYINEDTYQTLQDVKVKQDSSQPIWVKEDKPKKKPKYSLFVATPVHSDVSIHYMQACLELQKACHAKGYHVMFQLMKSSLVTQGRNLCVQAFLERPEKPTHLLFIDSDIDFNPESIFKMLEADKDVCAIPYPLKTVNWDKAWMKFQAGKIKTKEDLQQSIYMFPIRIPDDQNIDIKGGCMEVTHAPTGSMLIKRSVFDTMIEKYPELRISQKTVINGKIEEKRNMWNFFDTLHDPETKTYLGEDFAFCKRWREIGGKCYAYVNDYISHVGEHSYYARLRDELVRTDIDKTEKDK